MRKHLRREPKELRWRRRTGRKPLHAVLDNCSRGADRYSGRDHRVGGFYLATRQGEGPDPVSHSSGRGEITVNLSGTGGSAPTVPQAVSESDLNLAALDSGSALEDEVARMVNDCSLGDDEACQELLDSLVSECDAGYGLSCDVLYLISPAGTDYELFGGTCGGRTGPQYAGECAEL